MKKMIKIVIEKNYLLNKLARKIYIFYRRTCYNLKYAKSNIDDKLIVFESYNGRNISCSPKRIMEIMRYDDKFQDYELVVFLKNPEKYTKEYIDTNVKLVKYNSREYYKYIAKAKYIFTNSRISKYVDLKKEQIYVQCWHGTPLKRIGADIIATGRNGSENIQDTIKSYLHEGKRISYFVSPSKYASEKFITSFCLGILSKQNAIAEVGYPRNDFLVNATENDINKLKSKYNIDKSKKTILYAPTWRDKEYSSKDGYTYTLAFDIENMYKRLGNEYQILLRGHYFIKQAIDFKQTNDFIVDVSNIDDINELYLISDMLITDYSSVFFDYAILKKPVIFYMYDKKEYENDIRGFYLDLNELCGEIVETEKDLIENILNPKFDIDKHNKFIEKFCYLDDGDAGERLIDKVLKNE